MCNRESKPSERMLDDIYRHVRGLDKLIWNGNSGSTQDIEEYVAVIKVRLDEMVQQFKMEVAGIKFPDTVSVPVQRQTFEDPKPKEWRCTPIVNPLPRTGDE